MPNILTLTRLSAEDRAKIEGVDPGVKVTDAGGWFDGEYRETWPAFTSERYLAPNANGRGHREDRDRLLADADIILGGWPFPLDLRMRAPRLKWFHQRPIRARTERLFFAIHGGPVQPLGEVQYAGHRIFRDRQPVGRPA